MPKDDSAFNKTFKETTSVSWVIQRFPLFPVREAAFPNGCGKSLAVDDVELMRRAASCLLLYRS